MWSSRRPSVSAVAARTAGHFNLAVHKSGEQVAEGRVRRASPATPLSPLPPLLLRFPYILMDWAA